MKRIVSFFVIIICLICCACGNSSKLNSEDPGNLMLWNGKYMNGDYYAFDGMSLTYSFESFKERKLDENIEYELIGPYDEDEEYGNGKIMKTYAFDSAGDGEIIDRITTYYNFFGGKFSGGTVTASFCDIDTAIEFAKNLTKDIKPCDELKKEYDKQKDLMEYYGLEYDDFEEFESFNRVYVDNAGGYLHISAGRGEARKGSLSITYSENINKMMGAESRYFNYK